MRILCVDGDEDTCKQLVGLLGMAGLEAVTARDAASALGLMARERFALYVIDGRLPGLGGLAFCEEVRRVDKTTPIVFITGDARAAEREAAMMAGANAYVVKPYVSEVLPTVRRLLAEGRDAPNPE